MQPEGRTHLARWLHRHGPTLLLLAGGFCAFVSLLLTGGYPPGSRVRDLGQVLELPALLLFLAQHVWSTLRAPTLKAALRRRWVGHLLLLILLGQTLLLLLDHRIPDTSLLRSETLIRIYVASLQIYVLAGMVLAATRVSSGLARIRLRPSAMAFLSFLLLILAGSGVLMMPNMTPGGTDLAYVDAVFTATSACCVTGLTVVDTGTAFTSLGQTAILLLIQLGGLGIMALAAFLALAVGRDVGLREGAMLSDALNLGARRGVQQTLAFIVVSTLAIELVGAGAIFLALGSAVPSTGERAFVSAFHAVSAFCNAGFSTWTNSLEGFQRHPFLLATVTALLVLGGLGFVVLADCVRGAQVRIRSRRAPRARRSLAAHHRLSIQSRMVLGMSGVLLAAGWLTFTLLEWNGSLAGLPWHDRLMCGLFMAATPRTAGFSVTNAALWAPATILLLIIFMGIGGAPGSTAGGVKVTTLGVLVATLSSQMRRREWPVFSRREIPAGTIFEALVVLGVYVSILMAGTFVLLLSEGWSLQATLFETASAMGTVGLTLGGTPALSDFGKLVVSALMLVGRLGPLTIALAVARGGRADPARYPQERVMIG